MAATTAELNSIPKEAFSACFQQWRHSWGSVWSPNGTTLRVIRCPTLQVSQFLYPGQRSDTFLTDHVYPYHDQRVRLELGDHAQRMDLCHRVKEHPELLSVTVIGDEASFTRDGINNLRNVHTWSHRKNRKCFQCGRQGHLACDCMSRRSRENPRNYSKNKGFGTQNAAFRRGLRPEICVTLYCIISGKQKAA